MSTIVLPLWLFILILILALAAWASLDRFLVPSSRWLLRSRANEVLDEVAQRRKIQVPRFHQSSRRALRCARFAEPVALQRTPCCRRWQGAANADGTARAARAAALGSVRRLSRGWRVGTSSRSAKPTHTDAAVKNCQPAPSSNTSAAKSSAILINEKHRPGVNLAAWRSGSAAASVAPATTRAGSRPAESGR